MKYIKIGVIKNYHGLDGEVKVLPITEYPELIPQLDVFLLSSGEDIIKALRVENVRTHNEYFLVKLEGVSSKEEAGSLSGLEIMYPVDMLPELNEDEYYWFEIEGWDVFDVDGCFVGKLVDYEETGSVEAFRIENAGKFYLISNNPDHVLKIDKDAKKIIINRDGLVSEDL